MLKNYDSNDNLYIGGHGCNRNILNKNTYFHSGGPGFILTSQALHKIYPIIQDVTIFVKNWINICIQSNNATCLIPACDVTIAYIISLPEIQSKIIKLDGFYHCNYLGIPCHPNQFTFDNIYSCHLMSLHDFDNFTLILKDNDYYTTDF